MNAPVDYTPPQAEDTRSAPVMPPSVGFSPDFRAIGAAMVKAAQLIQNPSSNKTAEVVSRRTNARFTYKYATLPHVLDTIRLPLASVGVFQASMLRGSELDVMLVHGESGQWMKVTFPIRPTEDGIQALSSCITTARRQGLKLLCGIADDDDDDGSHADGKVMTDVPDWQPAGEPVLPIVAMARRTVAPMDGARLLEAWMHHRADVERLRHDSARRADFEAITLDVRNGLNRAFDGAIAAAWASYQLAETREQEAKAAQSWEGKWEERLRQLREKFPDAHAALMRHRHARSENIAATTPPPAPGFAAAVLDAHGDPVGEVYTDAVRWAEAFAHTWTEADADDRAYLDEVNAEAISAAETVTGAAVVLSDLYNAIVPPPVVASAPAASPSAAALAPIAAPTRRDGGVDTKAYLALTQAAIAALVLPDEFAAWEKANSPVYASPGMSSVATIKVMTQLAARKRELGFALPQQDE